MATVGVRELKNNLSSFLRRAAAGEVIVVTDHGRVVAEIRQPAPVLPGYEDMPAQFWDQVARGEIILAAQPLSADFLAQLPRSKKGYPAGTALRLLDEDRGS